MSGSKVLDDHQDDTPLLEVLEEHHNGVVNADMSLNVCVGTLKEAMMTIIRRKKQEGAAVNGNSH